MSSKNPFPKLTLNVAVRNEEKRLPKLLNSILKQTYPRSRLELLIVDGMSTDQTLEIVKKYSRDFSIPMRIIKNIKIDPATGRTLGLLNATGDLHLYLDADMELAEPSTLEKLASPFLENQEIAGTFTRLLSHNSDPPLNTFLSHNPFQHDPMFEFLSTSLDDTVYEKNNGYYKCIFKLGSVPVVGVILTRTESLKKVYSKITKKWPNWMWSDVDLPIALTQEGLSNFIYVANTGIYHHSYVNLSTFFRKKKRDVTWSYLSTYKNRYATYINLNSKKDLLKLLGFILYSESLFLPLIRGLYKAIKFRDQNCLFYEPILSWGITNYVISLLVLDTRGRKFLFERIRNLVK
jgi:glycosyltransferase involved in cell wall biosynthesis